MYWKVLIDCLMNLISLQHGCIDKYRPLQVGGNGCDWNLQSEKLLFLGS